MGITEQLLILLVFIFLSAFFSGVETAFVSLSEIRIQHLLEQEKKGIRLVKTLKDNNERLIITILIITRRNVRRILGVGMQTYCFAIG